MTKLEKKKILVFIDWYLPGYKAGGPIQSVANLISHLGNEFDFSVVTRDTDYCDDKPYANIVPDEWNEMADGSRVYYISKKRLYRKTIRKIILSEDFDVVYLNGLFSLYFTLIPLYYLKRIFSLRLSLKSSKKLVIVAVRGMLAEGALLEKSSKKAFFLNSVRIIRLFNNVIFHASNEQEAGEVRLYFGHRQKIRIAPNLPKKAKDAPIQDKVKEKHKAKLVSIARIAPEKGILQALETLLKVKQEIIFDLFGPVYDEAYWKECQKLIGKMPLNIKVNYLGSLESSQIHEKLQEYNFLFMPTKGENFGHIIVEAFRAGLPVVISDKTPWRGLSRKYAGWDISLSDSDAFVKAIETAAEMDQQEYKKWESGAQKMATEILKDDKALEMNKKLFQNE